MALRIRFGQACVVSLAAICIAAPVLASGPQESARYEMERVEDGFLRLDRQTGEVSHCREIQGAWACQLVPDERKAYEKRIGKLEDRNAELSKKLDEKDADLPSDEEMDKAFSFFDGFMDRFAELARKFRDRMEDMDAPPSGDPRSGGI